MYLNKQLSIAFVAAGLSAISGAQTFRVTATAPKSLTGAGVSAAEKKSIGVSFGTDKKSLVVKSKSARLVVRTGPKSDMMSYRIDGLRNPTITAPAGAKLRILFVNVDDDMLHNLRFTVKQPPFEAKIGNAYSGGSASLPHMKGNRFSTEELTVIIPARKGAYNYICTIPGHASAGMFGKLIVR